MTALATAISDIQTLFKSAASTSISLSVAHTHTHIHTLPTSADSVTISVSSLMIRGPQNKEEGVQRVYMAGRVRAETQRVSVCVCVVTNLHPGSINTPAEPNPKQPSSLAPSLTHRIIPHCRHCCCLTTRAD